jgi:acyl-CoA synthetase (AMP-forming)/AMP-acid ligase II
VLARAGALAAAGVQPAQRIALSGGSAPVLVDLFALWQLGAVALLLPESLTAPERARVQATLAPDGWIGAAPEAGRPLPAEPSGRAAPDGPPELDLDRPALILATSGTTAAPKAVVLTHRALLARIALNLEAIPAAALQRTLAPLPLHFGHGLIGNSLTALAAGASLFCWPAPGLGGLARLGPVIERLGITFLSSVPALWQVALKASLPPPAGLLKRVHVGSAPLPLGLWERIAAWAGTREVWNVYGITEAANWIAGAALADAEEGCVGRPWGGRLALRDDSGRLQSEGTGEVMVSSPALMQGYLGQEEESRRVLAGGWLATGDLGRIGPDGRLFLVGRLKHEINRAGIKVPAEEIDFLLARHPAVEEACAFPLPDPVLGEAVAAAVVTRGTGIGAAALIAWCAERIRREAVPARIFLVDSLPRNERGKVQRALVRQRCLELAQ